MILSGPEARGPARSRRWGQSQKTVRPTFDPATRPHAFSRGTTGLRGCDGAQSLVVVVAEPTGRDRRLDQRAAAERVLRALPAGPEPADAHLPDGRANRPGSQAPAGQGAGRTDLFDRRKARSRSAAPRHVPAESLARRVAERQRQGKSRAGEPAD